MIIPLAALFFLLSAVLYLVSSVLYTVCQETFTRNLADIPPSIFNASQINVQIAGMTITLASGLSALRSCQQGSTVLQAAGSLGFDTTRANTANLITQQVNNLDVNNIINSLNLQ